MLSEMRSSSRLFGVVILAAATAVGFVACGGSGSGGGAEGSGADGTGADGGGGDAASGGGGNATGGADGSGGIPGFSTGVDGSKRPTDLTPGEIEEICDATEEYIYSAITDADMCRAMAAVASLESADPVAACEAAYEQCLETRTDEGPIGCVVDGDCDITVAEYEACVEQLVTSGGPPLSNFPECADVSPLALLPLLGLTELPACTLVTERCGSPFPAVGDGRGGAGGN